MCKQVSGIKLLHENKTTTNYTSIVRVRVRVRNKKFFINN